MRSGSASIGASSPAKNWLLPSIVIINGAVSPPMRATESSMPEPCQILQKPAILNVITHLFRPSAMPAILRDGVQRSVAGQ